MGSRGFGFLYVREDLQGSVVKTTRYGHRQVTRFDMDANSWELEQGAARYETGNVSNVGAACVYESLRYILNLGVENIRNHVRPLTDRLHRELPAMGYEALTPQPNESPIVVFRLKDAAKTAADLKRAGIATTVNPAGRTDPDLTERLQYRSRYRPAGGGDGGLSGASLQPSTGRTVRRLRWASMTCWPRRLRR